MFNLHIMFKLELLFSCFDHEVCRSAPPLSVYRDGYLVNIYVGLMKSNNYFVI